jgi:leader peptidase (prepilin peptidase)/N-methyltransferase
MRYPIIEAVHGALWGLIAFWVGWHPILFLLLAISSVSLALFVIDLDTQRLPDKIVASSWLMVFIGLPALAWHAHSLVALERAGICALVWGALYGALWLFSGGRALGLGDVKLAPVYGALTGWFSIASSIVGFAGAFLIGGLVAVVLIANGTVRKRGVHIAYGPMLITGAWMGIVWGIPLSNFYLHTVGLR